MKANKKIHKSGKPELKIIPDLESEIKDIAQTLAFINYQKATDNNITIRFQYTIEEKPF